MTTNTNKKRWWRSAAVLALGFGFLFGGRVASADTVPTLFSSFAGNVNFVGTQQTLRTQADGGDSCAVTGGATNATLSGLPAGATVEAAYLYWAGSGDTPDYDVTFQGSAVSADAARRYTATFTLGSDYNYFSGVADVTAVVAATGNATYSFSGLAVDTGDPWCASSAVMAGWALMVVYSHASEDFRVVNVYEGFQHFRGASITLTPSNFLVPSSPINGRNAHLTWEGDVGNSAQLNGFNEALTFNGNSLTDGNNPVNNQFNSVSTMSNPVDTTTYGVDFDVFDIGAYLSAGQSSATTVYSSGGDLVLLSAQVISTTNTAASDLAISMTRGGDLIPGQNASYTLTVTNNGPLSEPGSIMVVDTLPAGLSYVSFSGTGWSCGVAGQVVTCTRSGSLASGASAAALTLTVAVSAGASGTVTNTATVSGQNFDNDSSNDTATDAYTIIAGPYAYYAMDETAWGAVVDSSGNGRNGTAMGSATPTGYPPSSPPGGAIGGSPGTCGAGSVPTAAGSGVDTGIDINSIGNAGTITLWYSSNTAWNSGADRMLLDASNNLGGGGADKHFYLVKGDGGELRFGLEDNTDDNELVSSGGNSFPANEWHHIAITWDWNTSNTIRVYLDGVQQASTTIDDGIGNYSNLYIGATHSGIAGTDTDFTTNTANGYLDEVRIYSTALTVAEIAQVMNLTHACPGALHHLQIEHGSGAALTCNESTLTIRACADAACSTLYTGGISGTLTASGPPPTVNWVSGAGFTIAPGSSTTTETIHVTTTGSTTLGTSSESPAPSSATTCNFGSPSCTFTASDSGFVFDVPNHTAGTTQNVTMSALQTVAPNQPCVPAFQSVSKTVNFWSTYLNPNTGTLPVNVNLTDVAVASPGTALSLNFNASGQTTLQVRYPDVGQMTLNARHSGSGSSAGLIMNGQDNFVAKPYGFVLSNIERTSDGFDNPASTGPGDDPPFIGAGRPFSMTVTAVISDGSPDGGPAAPNYGQETVPEGVALRTPTLVGGGTNNPSIASTTGFGGFTNGMATGTDFNWPEVGIFTLTPGVGDGDYLGTLDAINITSGNIGRFTPDHFDITVPTTGCPAGGFSYSGQPFSVTVSAFSLGGTPTENFDSAAGFAKDVRISIAGDETNFSNNVVLGASAFTIGVGTRTDVTYTFPVKETLPLTPTTLPTPPATPLRGVDTDLVSSAGHIETQVDIRSGRVQIQNAFGSELLALPVPLRAQYYTANGWVTNAQDTCTGIAAADLTLNASPGPGPVAVGGGTTTASVTNNPLAAGDSGLSLSPPGAGNTGYVDVALDLSSDGAGPALDMPWLQFDWDGVAGDDNPQGRATFGVYSGSPRHIHIRERF